MMNWPARVEVAPTHSASCGHVEWQCSPREYRHFHYWWLAALWCSLRGKKRGKESGAAALRTGALSPNEDREMKGRRVFILMRPNGQLVMVKGERFAMKLYVWHDEGSIGVYAFSVLAESEQQAREAVDLKVAEIKGFEGTMHAHAVRGWPECYKLTVAVAGEVVEVPCG